MYDATTLAERRFNEAVSGFSEKYGIDIWDMSPSEFRGIVALEGVQKYLLRSESEATFDPHGRPILNENEQAIYEGFSKYKTSLELQSRRVAQWWGRQHSGEIEQKTVPFRSRRDFDEIINEANPAYNAHEHSSDPVFRKARWERGTAFLLEEFQSMGISKVLSSDQIAADRQAALEQLTGIRFTPLYADDKVEYTNFLKENPLAYHAADESPNALREMDPTVSAMSEDDVEWLSAQVLQTIKEYDADALLESMVPYGWPNMETSFNKATHKYLKTKNVTDIAGMTPREFLGLLALRPVQDWLTRFDVKIDIDENGFIFDQYERQIYEAFPKFERLGLGRVPFRSPEIQSNPNGPKYVPQKYSNQEMSPADQWKIGNKSLHDSFIRVSSYIERYMAEEERDKKPWSAYHSWQQHPRNTISSTISSGGQSGSRFSESYPGGPHDVSSASSAAATASSQPTTALASRSHFPESSRQSERKLPRAEYVPPSDSAAEWQRILAKKVTAQTHQTESLEQSTLWYREQELENIKILAQSSGSLAKGSSSGKSAKPETIPLPKEGPSTQSTEVDPSKAAFAAVEEPPISASVMSEDAEKPAPSTHEASTPLKDSNSGKGAKPETIPLPEEELSIQPRVPGPTAADAVKSALTPSSNKHTPEARPSSQTTVPPSSEPSQSGKWVRLLEKSRLGRKALNKARSWRNK